MATIDTLTGTTSSLVDRVETRTRLGKPLWERILQPIASLKLTVALFALANFLILAGTLAQVDKDIWQVIHEYFRTPIAWISFQLFFPKTWFPTLQNIPGGFWCPGGSLIGGLMAANLIAAHLIRFKITARGPKLAAGLGIAAAGAYITWLVIASGVNREGLHTDPTIPYATLWQLLKGAFAVSWLTASVWLFSSPLSPTAKSNTQASWAFRNTIGVIWLVWGSAAIWLFTAGRNIVLSDSAMRIVWQLTQGGIGGVVLLVACILLFNQRAGVVLLHAGIGLMMLGEMLVGMGAVEGQLQLSEGETANFLHDIRTIELAIVDRSDDKVDKVTVIPRDLLLQGVANFDPRPMWQRLVPRSLGQSVIDDPKLPFTVEVVKFFQHSSLADLAPGDDNLANTGMGLKIKAVEARAGTGTDTDSKVDLSAAYIRLKERSGSDLGTFLVSLQQGMAERPEKVKLADGKEYQLSLRFKRMYRPYEVTLKDVKKDDYVGTSTPRNYSSDIRLVNANQNVDREIHIWMNNPLRYSGETFYQSSYHRDMQSGIESTVLQVVTNTGWMIPYVSCMLVAIGMLAHFLVSLVRFARRLQEGRAFVGRTAEAAATTVASSDKLGKSKNIPAATPDSIWLKAGPALAALVAVAIIAVAWKGARPGFDNGMDLAAFGELPVASQGRIKPMDSLARATLLSISNRDYLKDRDDKTQPAIRWMLDTIATPSASLEHAVFRIENLELLELLGLERRKNLRYSYREFGDSLEKFSEEAQKAAALREKHPEQLSAYQRKVIDFASRVRQFDTLAEAFSPPRIRQENALEDVKSAIRDLQRLKATRQPPLAIPPGKDEGEWETFAEAFTRDLVKTALLGQKGDSTTSDFTEIMMAYATKDAPAFNKAIDKYRLTLKEANINGVQLGTLRFEAFFNRLQPFSWSFRLYVMAFTCAFICWLGVSSTWIQSWSRSALVLALAALLIHTFALGARIYISGRPPVTNLYSAAVFVGWGAALLALVFEFISGLGIGVILAGAAGAITLTVAGYLGNDGDTFTVLQAVLDTQFWLSTHVTCITFGYATTYLGGFLGLLYVVLGVFTPRLNSNLGKELARMMYGTVCFSIFFSFVGTVLGGLWADDSWGRFWGWDPKENGALMIVLWNALILHARWGAMIKDRGLAVLCIFGNIVVSWSFFAVNELGVGLHTYGQTDGTLRNLALFAISQLVLMACGLLPQSCWWSLKQQQPLETPSQA